MSDDDLPSLLAKREHARPNRMTWVLLSLLLVVVGFMGGAYANQRFGASSSAPSGFPAGISLPALGSGQPTGPGAFGDMTVGTVKLVDRTNLYITTTSGETVKVVVPAEATVTSQKDVDLVDLAAGTTVLVRGAAGADGTVTATSVAEGALPGGPGAPTSTSTSTSDAPASSTTPSQGDN